MTTKCNPDSEQGSFAVKEIIGTFGTWGLKIRW